MVLRVKKKFFVIEPIPSAPLADSKYLRSGMRFILIMRLLVLCSEELKSMFDKQDGVELFDQIQTFHACKQEKGKSVSSYVLKMEGYVEKLERLGYVLIQDLSTIGKMHALLIEYEKGLSKKAVIPQVMVIQGGRIQKANIKSLNAKGKGKGEGKGKDKQGYIPKPKNSKPSTKEHPTKDDTCHHCKEVGHWKRNCPAYLAKLIKKKKKVGTASSSDIFTKELFSFLINPGCMTLVVVLTFVTQNGVFEDGRAKELKEIPDKDTSPSENTSEIPMEVEGFEPPQEEFVSICRSARTNQDPERLCLNVEVEEHSLGDLNEPTNYKVALLDSESDKWLGAMNAEMQSMKDNQVLRLVDLLYNAKGFTQTYGVDYVETFSPVADIRAIKILIAIATFYDYEIWQMDVKIVFLKWLS
ncbi:retrotransposon protein, putative, ty1-copia subclass [Tanacetum coccineum]